MSKEYYRKHMGRQKKNPGNLMKIHRALESYDRSDRMIQGIECKEGECIETALQDSTIHVRKTRNSAKRENLITAAAAILLLISGFTLFKPFTDQRGISLIVAATDKDEAAKTDADAVWLVERFNECMNLLAGDVETSSELADTHALQDPYVPSPAYLSAFGYRKVLDKRFPTFWHLRAFVSEIMTQTLLHDSSMLPDKHFVSFPYVHINNELYLVNLKQRFPAVSTEALSVTDLDDIHREIRGHLEGAEAEVLLLTQKADGSRERISAFVQPIAKEMHFDPEALKMRDTNKLLQSIATVESLLNGELICSKNDHRTYKNMNWCLVTDKRFSTMDELKKEFYRYCKPGIASTEQALESYYHEFNGKLYVMDVGQAENPIGNAPGSFIILTNQAEDLVEIHKRSDPGIKVAYQFTKARDRWIIRDIRYYPVFELESTLGKE